MAGFDRDKLNAKINDAHEELDLAVYEMDKAGRSFDRADAVGGAEAKRLRAAAQTYMTGPSRVDAAFRKILLTSWQYNKSLAQHLGVPIERPDIDAFIRLPRISSTCRSQREVEHNHQLLRERLAIFTKLDKELFDQQVELGAVQMASEGQPKS